jgi:hypothetical protein
VLPGVMKMLFGLETMFTRSGFSLLNTTFFAVMFGLAYLCVDPIAKTAYVMRCFYGQSLQSGEDLKAELRRWASVARQLAACLAIALTLTGAVASAGTGGAADAQPSSSSLSTPELDRAIQRTIQQSKYAWRAPREKILEPESAEKGILGRFLERVRKMVRQWLVSLRDWLEGWLRKLFRNQRVQSQGGGSGYGWIMLLQILLYGLVAAVVSALAVLLFRLWQNRGRKATTLASQPIEPTPDLADENVGAEHLPQDGWTKLARELLARGELRLALRAFYLASLAHLAERNLIRLARFKSNRDYERELQRRGHSLPDLLSLFGENVLVFDRVWYGLHEINNAMVERFAANVERINTT